MEDNTIYISIKLFATLNIFLPDEPDSYPLPKGTMVQELIEKLKIPVKDAKLIFVNSRRVLLTAVLKNGDRVAIFPPVGGG